jgi:dCMP deaminase
MSLVKFEQNYKWDIRFLEMAKLVSSWSKDPSTKVGSVITDKNNRVISLGYNGFPQSIVDDQRLEDRDTKYQIIVHGEMNAILFANQKLDDCILYTYPFEPCPRCAGIIIQSGIKTVVAPKNNTERWEKDFKISRILFEESNIELRYYTFS